MNLIRKIIGVLKRENPPEQNSSCEGVRIDATRLHRLIASIDNLIGVERVPLLTYEDAVRSFVSEKPSGNGTVKGALLCANAGFGDTLVTWAYLDRNNIPLIDDAGKLLGKKLIVSSLDDELAECFSGSDILIVE